MQYSKKQINRSGKFLAQNINTSYPDNNETNLHLDVFNYWRSLHSYVMNVIYVNLKRRIQKLIADKEISEDIILVQRLKRTPSILSKLNRFENMNLSRMQDIAGVRIIVKKTTDIYKIKDNITKSFPHKLCDEKNYINEPKLDGYRCLHMIFEMQNLKENIYNGLNVELQIRTELQHQWATAVEILGLYKKQSYKSGLGDEDTKEFLCLCSNLLAIQEGTPIDKKYYNYKEKELYEKLKELNDKLNIIDTLKGLTVAVEKQEELDNSKKVAYYLVLLKLDEKKLNLSKYTDKEIAKKRYADLEQQIQSEQKKWDVVLISLNDIKKLRSAYPNYYLDSKKFIKTIQNLINKAQ